MISSCDQDQKLANKLFKNGENPLHILATLIQKVNLVNSANFLSLLQLGVKEPETYK